MPRPLLLLMAITDIAFLFYWAVSALFAAHLVEIPPDWLFKDYHDPRAVAWNWSFLPPDLAFSALGLWSIRAAQRGKAWRTTAALSLALCSTVGGMAIAYWVLLGEYDPAWFLPNLLLCAWPLFFLPALLKPMAGRSQLNDLGVEHAAD